jgi:plasmid maintenance system antidote protein VapI
MNRQDLLETSEYQLTKIQLDLCFKLVHYMETNNLTVKEAAKQLNTKRRVIKKTLNGDFNYSLETFITLANAIGYNIEITFNKKH